MRVELYDLSKPVALMPGETIKEIMAGIGGKLLAAGIVSPSISAYKDEEAGSEQGHIDYYIKNRYKGPKIVESVWRSDGCECFCIAKKDDGKTWKIRRSESDWEPIENKKL